MKKKIYFIGDNKVKNYVVHENIDLVGVLFDNGKNEDYTTEQWTNLRSEKKYDEGHVSIRKHEKLMQRILKEMVDSRVTIGDYGWIFEQIGNSIGVNYRSAISKTFDVKNAEAIMLAQIDEILRDK